MSNATQLASAVVQACSEVWARGDIVFKPSHGGEEAMQTLDDMLSRKLLTTDQHTEIAAWVTGAKTPDAILQMPERLWRSLELASVLMNVDADLLQPPLLSLGS